MPYIGTSPSNGVRQTYDYTATAGQTSFSGSDNNSQTLRYTDSAYIDVYQNGILLLPSDYVATSGTTVVLDVPAILEDTVQIVAYDVFSVADTVSASDGGSFAGNVGIGGTLAVTGALTGTTATFTTDDNNPQLTLISTDADASSGPVLELYRNSSSPADDDVLGEIEFHGENDADEKIQYGLIAAKLQDASDGTEDVRLSFKTITAGTERERITIQPTETVFNEDSQDLDFRVESNGNANMIFVDGGNDKVGIGNNNPNDFGSLAADLVIGTTSGEHGLTIVTGTDASARMQFADNTSSPFVGAIEYAHGSSNSLIFYTDGSSRLTINATGNLVSPATYSSTTANATNMRVESNGVFVRSTSSRRYKNTIEDATKGLAELQTLRPVTYKGNNDGEKVFGGLIAEEVHDAGLTEFVEYNENDEPDALAYGHMVSLCIKAIQELKTELDEAKARITALESK